MSEIQRVLSDAALAWLGNVAFLLGAVGMLLWLDWRLFLAAAVLLPPAIWAIVVYRRRLEVRVRVMRERSARIGAFLIETLRGVRLGGRGERGRNARRGASAGSTTPSWPRS